MHITTPAITEAAAAAAAGTCFPKPTPAAQTTIDAASTKPAPVNTTTTTQAHESYVTDEIEAYVTSRAVLRLQLGRDHIRSRHTTNARPERSCARGTRPQEIP